MALRLSKARCSWHLLLRFRQLRTVIGNENREQTRWLGGAAILADQVNAAGGLEEPLARGVHLGRPGGRVLRSDRSRQYIREYASSMSMLWRLAAGLVVHDHCRQALTGDVR